MKNNSFSECILCEMSFIFSLKNKTSNAGIVYIVISLFLLGCNQNNHDPVDGKAFTVDYHTKKTEHFEEFFDINNMSIIRFEDINPLLLSEKLQIEFTEKYFFILDKGYEQLYRFDYSGKLLNKIGRSGQGPAEYLNAGFFAIDESRQTINILCDNGSAIMIFDFDGNFEKKFSTPLIVTSFDCLNSNLYYYYTGYNNSPSFHRLHMADTVKILESYLPLNTRAFDMIEMNFTPMGGYGYFRETFFPPVYKYTSTGIKEIFTMDFGSFEITQQMLEEVEDPFDFFQKTANIGFCSTKSVIVGKNKFYVVAFQQDLRATQVSHFYIDLVDSVYTRLVSYENQQTENDFFNQLKPVYLDSAGQLYFATNPIDLKAFMQSRPDLLLTDPLQEENLNPLILKIPLKKN